MLIYGLMCAAVLANEPGGAALDFLEKVRAGEVDLAPGADTALQENTGDAKLRQIRQSLERLEEDLLGGSLELGEVREDDGFAAVIVKKTGGFDSGHLQIFPIALVKKGADWFPAPMPASFENAVAGYTLPLREKLGELERWMSRERVLGLEKLISDSAARTRVLIEKSIVGENLEGDDFGKITELFMEACREGNQAAVLGYLGGLSEPLPEDWSERVRASQKAVVSDSGLASVWRLIVSPEVVRVQVDQDRSKTGGLVSIAFLDPARADKGGTLGKIEILHFAFSKDSNGRWQMNLPDPLLRDDSDSLDYDDDLDVELLDRFTKLLRKTDPAQASPSALLARDAVLGALKEDDLRDLLSRVDLSGRKKQARIACASAAEVWWSLHQPGSFRAPVELGFREEGILAAAAYQWFSPTEPDQFELKVLYFKKTEGGWMWAAGDVSGSERESQNQLSAWINKSEAGWRTAWREVLLANSERIEKIDFSTEIEDGEVDALVGRWLEALAARDLTQVLKQTASLGKKDEVPMKILRNLSYDLETARQGKGKMEGIQRSKSWVAAHVSTGEGEDRKDIFLLVVSTPSGPRLLPEIDILAGGDRTRKFLNQVSFDRLKKFASDEKITQLEKLFKQFESRGNTGD